LISHVFIGIGDFIQAHHFYTAIMEELGYEPKFCDTEKCWSGWIEKDVPRPLFVIGKPFNGQAMSPGNGQMVALISKTRQMVDLTYQRAISLGATCEGPPGLRPHYHPHYYGAYFRDLDGNKIGVCCHEQYPS
jgi:catechol 2,3-dioxygenase-like lactoylglutathione lyase family enzyme